MAESAYTGLEVFNAAGSRVAKLIDREAPAGLHSVDWNAKDVPSGVYFLRLTSGVEKATTRMILLQR